MSDQLRNKIQQWEASPPPAAWSAIAVAMEEVNAENKLAARLTQHEETPPAQIWDTIFDEISQKENTSRPPAPVIPMRPLYPYLFRYGAVAIVAGLAAWIFIGNPFWEKAGQNNTANISTNTASETPAKKAVTSSIISAIKSPDEVQPAPVENKDNLPSNNLPARDPQYATVHNIEYSHKGTAAHTTARPQPPIMSLQELPVQQRNQRYIIINSATGEPIRLSAKFAPLYYALDHSTDYNDPQVAKGLLDKMQQQMIRRPFIPDPNNHFDIIRLVDLLQQEQ